ncbi:MAG: NAD-dependent epimerase/dehydratase family protein [Gemmataceae bacterium]|nr:NAD-dependent epimerase/dehydratase family protein [Gemmataceae bacterium]
MNCVVTGSAGFIGSHLCEALLRSGHQVLGVDSFTPYYPEAVKRRNLLGCLEHAGFRFATADLRTDPLDGLLADAEVIFHLAAMPGLVRSWTDFDGYWTCNVLATQRILEVVRRSAGRLRRLIYASTSSVYGLYGSGDEALPTRPASPYGVTKLAGEHLCRAHAEAHGLPLVVLRYFSVYGPRQRPDMGYHRFIHALLCDEPVTVCGDGQQVRGNTYVTDCVEATIAAAEAPVGETYNIGGGEAASVWDILRKLENLAGRSARVKPVPARAGDQRYTFADTTRLRRHVGWEPRTRLDEGLAAQWRWQVSAVSDQRSAISQEEALPSLTADR